MSDESPMFAARASALVLCGLPGAGKTRLAQALARRLGLIRLSRDECCWRQRPAARESDPETAKRKAFQALLQQLDLALRAGSGVVVEGMPFSRRSDRVAVREVAQRHGADAFTLWLDCPPAIARRRIASDLVDGAHPAPDRRPALVDAVLARWETPEDALRLDAGQSFEAVLTQALAALRSRLRRT